MADDGVHPIDALRPYIYTETLAKSYKVFEQNDTAEKLNDEWDDLKNERESRDTFEPKVDHSHDPVSLEDARKSLLEAVSIILKEIDPISSKAQLTRWSDDNEVPTRASYEKFRTDFLNANGQAPEDASPKLKKLVAEVESSAAATTDEHTIRWKVGDSTVKWFDFFQKAREEKLGLTLLPETWSTLLDGGGWAAGGPEGGSNPPG
jgi:hypothetical protein